VCPDFVVAAAVAFDFANNQTLHDCCVSSFQFQPNSFIGPLHWLIANLIGVLRWSDYRCVKSYRSLLIVLLLLLLLFIFFTIKLWMIVL
jgi:hypothetical protein